MSELNIGKFIETPQDRDAIHVPIIPVTLVEEVEPGCRVVLEDGKARKPVRGEEFDGVIDPFLPRNGYEDETCWAFLIPGSIKSLRHDWVHSKLDRPTKEESEKWLRYFCERSHCPSFETVMKALKGEHLSEYHCGAYGSYKAYEIDEDSFHFNGTDAHSPIPDEFWEHAENYLGIKLPYKPSQFSCMC